MKTSNQLFLLGMLSALSAAAAAAGGASGAGETAPNTSKWECKSCPFAEGTSGTVDVGIGNVSKSSIKFGDYTGLDEKGGFFIGDGSVRSRGKDGSYWNVDGSNLGLRSRSLDAEGGTQGKYKLLLDYDEIQHFTSKILTPFNGTGGASLGLPAGFPAATTGAMPLAGTVQTVDLVTDRKRLGVGGAWLAARDWAYAVNFRHDKREGTKRTAGAFFFNSAELVEPVDYVTDQLDASASYTGSRLQAKFAYYGSKFRNGNESLTWQNPFALPAFPGAVAGQLALAPDNQFHQVLASVGYDFGARTRFSADIAVGRMTQNEGFLAPTLNATLAAPVVPASSLNGRVATMDASLKLTSAVTSRLRLNAAYTHNDRDNQTPQSTYTLVSTDLFLGAPRTNLPYSFTQDKVKFSGDYRFSALTKASAGIDHDIHERTFQETNRTRENTFWGRITSRALEKVDLTFKLARAERRHSGYRTVPEIAPPENPLLRKYNMANRTRDTGGLRADFAVAENVNLGVGFDASSDTYRDSTIGLTSGRDYSLNGDISVIVTPQTSLHLFANHQEIEAKQAGSQTFSDPDWSAETKDRINFVGIGLKHAAIKDKLDLGADYVVSRARSRINVITGAGDPAFPNITSSLDSVKLYASYRLKDNITLRADFWHERFDSANWMLENVTPNTIPNVLTFGEVAPKYRLNVIRLAVRYKF